MMDEQSGKVTVSLTQDEPVSENIRGSLQAYVARLTVPQKVELAAKGNREVRQILSRDASAMVARAVIVSPRLSELDVMSYAGSPTTHEDILRAIGESREWMSKPRLLMLLVSNPRTPPPVATRLLGRLPVSELNALSRNPGVSPPVRREAKRLITQRRI